MPLKALSEPTIASRIVCSPEAPHECAADLRAGEKAPFAGQLLTPSLAARLGVEADNCPRRVALEVRTATASAAIELRYEKRLHAIDLQQKDREINLWKEAVQKTESLPFWERPPVVAAVACVATLAVVALTVQTLKYSAK